MADDLSLFKAEGIGRTSERLWLRSFELVIGDDQGTGLDISAFQVRFTVTSQALKTPRSLEARIYNLGKDTTARLIKEFTQVRLSAGYQDRPLGVLFRGTICNTRVGRENATDTYVDILASDGDVAHNQSTVNTSVPAGWTREDIRKILVDSLENVKQGFKPDLATDKAPRGKVLQGMTRDQLQVWADANGVDWHIEDGLVHFIPHKSWIPGDAIVLTSASGMVGVPEQTSEGVNVRALLNPKIKTGYLLKIDNASITYTNFRQSFGLDVSRLPDLDRDGFYKIYSVRHTGDTRGTTWYTDVICAAVTPTLDSKGNPGIAPLSGPYVNAVVDGR